MKLIPNLYYLKEIFYQVLFSLMVPRPVIKFKLLSTKARIPDYIYDNDAGFSIYSNESIVLKKGSCTVVSTGVASEIPKGYFVSFRDRSGLSFKFNLHLLGGVIDAGYRGEWKIVIANLSKSNYTVQEGERIAQGILHKIPRPKIVKVKKLTETKRGEKGFGSTGKK